MSEYKSIERALDECSHGSTAEEYQRVVREQRDFARRVAKAALRCHEIENSLEFNSADGGRLRHHHKNAALVEEHNQLCLALAALEREAKQMNGGGR